VARNLVPVAVALPPELAVAYLDAAHAEGISRSALVRRVLADHMDQDKEH
jgi:hypothetical protein